MNRVRLEIIVVSFLVVAVAGFGVIRYFRALEASQAAREQVLTQTLDNQQDKIDELALAINILAGANKAAQKQIEEETAKRLAAEAQRQAEAASAARQIAELQKNITSNKPVDLSTIISNWRPRIASVRCRWQFGTWTAQTAGSGVLFSGGAGGAKIITNRHVITYQNLLPTSCAIKFPDDSNVYNIPGSYITVSANGADAAFIELNSTSDYIRSLAASGAARCTATPVVGDQIVILGYPSIGASYDITATEGIVSGFDNDYFITSAKVERGNSGGAAVLSKSNCYLGIPTFVDIGQIEALARILDQRKIGG